MTDAELADARAWIERERNAVAPERVILSPTIARALLAEVDRLRAQQAEMVRLWALDQQLPAHGLTWADVDRLKRVTEDYCDVSEIADKIAALLGATIGDRPRPIETDDEKAHWKLLGDINAALRGYRGPEIT